jgi:hypothetical protein
MWVWLLAAGIFGLILWKTRQNAMQANAEAQQQASARTLANWRLPFDEQITKEMAFLKDIFDALEKKNAAADDKNEKKQKE